MNTNIPKSALLFSLLVLGPLILSNLNQDPDAIVSTEEKLTPYQPSQEVRTLVEMLEVNNHDLIEQSYQRLFDGAGIDEMNQLKFNENDSISVQTAWEIARLGEVDLNSLRFNFEMFVGFVEATFQINVPDWWADHIVQMESTAKSQMAFPTLQRTHAGELICALETSLVETTDGVELRHRDKAVVVRRNLFGHDQNEPLSGRVAVAFSAEKCFISFYDDGARAHPVVCVDTQTGVVVWRSTCAGARPNVFGSGVDSSYVEMKLDSRGRIYVFGASGLGNYVQIFDQANGKSVAQFSTRYQHRPSRIPRK